MDTDRDTGARPVRIRPRLAAAAVTGALLTGSVALAAPAQAAEPSDPGTTSVVNAWPKKYTGAALG